MFVEANVVLVASDRSKNVKENMSHVDCDLLFNKTQSLCESVSVHSSALS